MGQATALTLSLAALLTIAMPMPRTRAGGADLAPFEGPPKVRVEAWMPPAPVARTITVTATSYCSGITTFTGAKVGVGSIAVDPRIIPLGSHLYVPGYGDGVADDTGALIQGRRVDVYYPPAHHCAASVAWGARAVSVEILGTPRLSHDVPPAMREVGVMYERD